MRSAPALLALLLAAPPALAKAPTWLNGGEDPWLELEREAAAHRAQEPAPPPRAERPQPPPQVDDSPPAPARARVTDLPPDDPYYEPFDDPMTAPMADPLGGMLPDGRVTATAADDEPAVEACPMVQRDDLAAALAEERAKLDAAAAELEAEVDTFAAEADAIAAALEAEAQALDPDLAPAAATAAAELGPPPTEVEPPAELADPNDDPAPWLDEPMDPVQPDLTRVSLAIVEATNVAREAHGLRPVKGHPALNAAAAGHARRMAELGFFDHEDPHEARRRTPTDRARLAGVRNPQIAENIATQLTLDQTGDGPLWAAGRGFAASPDGDALPAHTYRSFARRVVQRWLDSPGHRANLLAKAARQMGAGAAYFEQPGGVPTLTAVQVFQWHQPVRTRTLPRRTVSRR